MEKSERPVAARKAKAWRKAGSTIRQAYITTGTLFKPALNNILRECYEERDVRKASEVLTQTLEYLDRRTGQKMYLTMRDLVFVNWRTGEPAKNSSYDTHLYKLCDEAGFRRFVCILMQPELLKAGCRPECYRSCWAMLASKRLWIATSMSRTIHWSVQYGNLKQTPYLHDKLVRDWCGNKSRTSKIQS